MSTGLTPEQLAQIAANPEAASGYGHFGPQLTAQQQADISANPEAASGPGHFTNLPATNYGPPPPPGTSASQGSGAAGVLSDPGVYEQWVKDHIGDFNTPTNVEQLYGSGASNPLNTSQTSQLGSVGPGVYQSWATQGAAALSGPGAESSLYPGAVSTLGSNNAASDFYGSNPFGGIISNLGAVNGAQTAFNASEGALSQPGAVQNVYGKFGNAFNDPGAYEKFYQGTSNGGSNDPLAMSDTEKLYNSGIGQLNPFYDYASQRAIEQAQNASAARGSFNTGLAAQQESDILGNLRGQQAQEMTNLAPQADAARISRLALGSNEANTANADYENRINDIFGLASKEENAQEGRFKTLSDIGSAADNSAIGVANAQTNAGNAQANAAAAADASTRANVAGEESAAQNADQDALARIKAQQGILDQSEQLQQADDAENRARAAAADTEQRARIDDIYNQAGQADNAYQGRLGAQAALALGEQNAGQDRLGTAFGDTNKLDSQEAGLVQNILGNENQQIADLDDTQLQALADYYGVNLQELKDLATAGGKVVDIGSSIAKMAATSGGGAGGK